jgi:hypothetical protein
LNRVGHLDLVKSTLTEIPIFSMMSIDIPVENLLVIEKIIMCFFWKERKDVHGGHYLVAWDKVLFTRVAWRAQHR